ncbi:MAG: TIR domain-containing protein [Desulfobacterales bacterium]|nr:TIR domain-containing protein [Desulfobacterales bacterium]
MIKSEMDEIRVFISYIKEDLTVAEKLYADIQRKGVNPWMASKDLLPGQKWKDTITQAIKKSQFFISLLSSASVKKDSFVQKELKIALELQGNLSSSSKIFIIPVRVDKCNLDDMDQTIQELHRVNLFPSYEAGLNKILSVLPSDEEDELISCIEIEEKDYFINREEALNVTYGTSALSRILFEAPPGYGKTKLLRIIGNKHHRDGWICVYVEIPYNIYSAIDLGRIVAERTGFHTTSFNDVSALGYVIAGYLKNLVSSKKSPGAILLIDNVERLKENELEIFFDYFLKAIQQSFTLRIYLAGRYIGSPWKKRVKVMTLSPFQLKDTTLRLSFSNHKQTDLISAYLMNMTGGHPGCMAKIIEFITPAQFVEENYINNQESYKNIILPVINEVRGTISESLQDKFDTLCVFRRYNYRLLKKLIDMKLILYKHGADKLERELTTTYWVKRNADTGFIQDDIVRRLLAIRLRWEDFDRFTILCEEATKIYKNDLQTPKAHTELTAVEALYQELQFAYYHGEKNLKARESIYESFFSDNGILNNYLKILDSKQDSQDVKANFIVLLEDEKDWEFQYTVNFFMRSDQYNNEPYTKLVKQVKDFFKWEE